MSIGFGSVIIGGSVTIGDDTAIGFLTVIRGRTITIGAHVSIGAITFIDTPHIEIGDGTKINEQVFVGGLQYPDSKFIVGKNSQIMQMSFINPAKSIVIGNDTGIGGDCLIFGHSSWLSRFEGYDVEFNDIVIGNSVSLAWRVFVLPGTRIGDGSVVGANSLVNRTIPPKSLAVGFPARVVSKAPDFPKQLTDSDKKVILCDVVKDMIEYFNGFGIACGSQNGNEIAVTSHKKTFWGTKACFWKLLVLDDRPFETDSQPSAFSCDILLSLWRLPQHIRLYCRQKNIFWIDIESKERPDFDSELGEEIVLFFKRYGVRLYRVNGLSSGD
ncbi:MAG: hypothetical protein AB7S77_09520 [Desulfatirhabdiaceae bacterium]